MFTTAKRTQVQTDIHYEVTDLFGGEPNYSWVKRGKTAPATITQAKQPEALPTFKGTAKELISRGLTINGKPVDEVGLSVMSSYTACQNGPGWLEML